MIRTLAKPRPLADHFWEIDALRGVAIVMMVTFHFVYDLYAFGISNTVFEDRFWHYFQRTTASLFIGLVGLSLAISYARAAARSAANPPTFRKYIVRGGRILAWALLISAVTYFALGPNAYIQFGILHFIGVSVILAYPFLALPGLSNRWVVLTAGTLLLTWGRSILTQPVETPWLVWLGFMPPGYAAVDYFPLAPWFGLVLVGVGLGKIVYSGNRRQLALPDLSALAPVRGLTWLGQRSLPIYLIHQPLLYAGFILFTGSLG